MKEDDTLIDYSFMNDGYRPAEMRQIVYAFDEKHSWENNTYDHISITWKKKEKHTARVSAKFKCVFWHACVGVEEFDSD